MRLFLAVIAMAVAGLGWAAGNAPAPQDATVKGVVLEVRDADPYTYLRLKTTDGETWAAVNKVPAKTGDSVTIENAMVMTDFTSKTLQKTFETIVFGTVTDSAPAAADLGQIHAGVSMAPAVADVKIAKAEGADARTVAEIVGKRAELKDKPVSVSGKVVKFTADVMGRNWIHLRDGSGSAADNTNDILVTTDDETKIGDIVLARGTVRTDVDFGSGYAYKVLIEGAKLRK